MARYSRKTKAKKTSWRHVGGGTAMGSWAKKLGKYVCDDQYENAATGESVVFCTTRERHFGGMPQRVANLGVVSRLSGVKKAPKHMQPQR